MWWATVPLKIMFLIVNAEVYSISNCYTCNLLRVPNSFFSGIRDFVYLKASIQDFKEKGDETQDCNIIEGFHAKWVYIAFWADFHFFQDQAYFWETDLF